jgi:hypothetical protein
MAPPTTRSGLTTRHAAPRVELDELATGCARLSGGLDAGSKRNQDAAYGLGKTYARASKHLQAAGVAGLTAQLVE